LYHQLCIDLLYLEHFEHAKTSDALRLLGWWPLHLVSVAKTILLCSILFAGPLFESAIIQGRLKFWISGAGIVETFSSSTGWRNFVAGPVSEELVFRSLVIPLHIIAHTSPKRLVFVTPLYFGIAHIHHLYEFMLTHPKCPLVPAILRTLFQFTYTSLFGFFAAFVFLRTGSLYAVIAAHAFCNWMGLPKFWGRIKLEDDELTRPSPSRKEDDDTQTSLLQEDISNQDQDQDLPLIWTITYYFILVLGAIGFWKGLWSLTESGEKALALFGTD